MVPEVEGGQRVPQISSPEACLTFSFSLDYGSLPCFCGLWDLLLHLSADDPALVLDPFSPSLLREPPLFSN
jgi:hypothetical protein